MSDIALYNALTKLGLKHDEAKEAVADVANSREVATKAEIIYRKNAFSISNKLRENVNARWNRDKASSDLFNI